MASIILDSWCRAEHAFYNREPIKVHWTGIRPLPMHAYLAEQLLDVAGAVSVAVVIKVSHYPVELGQEVLVFLIVTAAKLLVR